MNTSATCFLLLLLGLLSFSCKTEPTIDYQQLPAYTTQGINMVVEIPAGTNHKIEYDYKTAQFVNDQEGGKNRIIDFLPYPGNYGYIPGTRMAKDRGGDGDALDVLLLSESLPTGTVVAVKPIAALVLKDGGELDTKIIAIPQDSTQQVIALEGFTHFMTEYSVVQTIIKDWFLNYKGLGKVELVGWQNERYAEEAIKKWKLD